MNQNTLLIIFLLGGMFLGTGIYKLIFKATAPRVIIDYLNNPAELIEFINQTSPDAQKRIKEICRQIAKEQADTSTHTLPLTYEDFKTAVMGWYKYEDFSDAISHTANSDWVLDENGISDELGNIYAVLLKNSACNEVKQIINQFESEWEFMYWFNQKVKKIINHNTTATLQDLYNWIITGSENNVLNLLNEIED